MLRTLIGKEFLELKYFYTPGGKNGIKKPGMSRFVLIILAVCFVCVAFAFFGISTFFSSEFVQAGTEWMYFSMLYVLALLFGTFGSVFSTYNTLYKAKDNDLLLAMPIPAGKILLSRVSIVFCMGFLFCFAVWVPGMIRYAIDFGVTSRRMVCQILQLFSVSFVVTVLTCILGWAVAKISSKLKSKAFMTVLITILFLGVYYVCYFRMNSILNTIAGHSEEITSVFRTWGFPIYLAGLGSTGEILPEIGSVLIAAALFALTYIILSKSFIKISTLGDMSAKREYRVKKAKRNSAMAAMLTRELKYFVSCPTYMLNTGLGVILLPAVTILAVVKKVRISYMLGSIQIFTEYASVMPAAIVLFVGFFVSMNCISAPSVSLEGKNLWIIRSMPVKSIEILKAKQLMHIILNGVPALVCTAALGVVFDLDAWTIFFEVLSVAALICFEAGFGLEMNLKYPNLEWTNETVPIKQSAPVLIAMLTGMLISLLMGAFSFAVGLFVGAGAAVCIMFILCAGVAMLPQLWIRKKGIAAFERL